LANLNVIKIWCWYGSWCRKMDGQKYDS